jgi:hypothetical protein
MARRDPRAARVLGLWTAVWLGVFLLGGLLWLGDLSLQWPVLAVPLLWGLVAMRPRRRPDDDDEDWEPIPRSAPHRPPPARTDTVERPALRRDDGRA